MTSVGRAAMAALSVTCRALATLSAVAILSIMLLTVGDVAQRWSTGRSIAGVLELNEILMVGVVYLALAYAQRRKEHVSVDLLVMHLPRQAQRWVEVVALLVSLAVVLLLLWTTLQAGLVSYARQEFRFGLRAVPIWPARLLIPLGLAFLTLEVLRDLVMRMADRLPERDQPTADEPVEPPWAV